MRIRRFLFGTLLFSCLLLLTQQARLAWAKDDDVLTVEGAITVNTAASTVRIKDMVLHVDDGTYISIDDDVFLSDDEDDTTLADLATFIGRNPDAYATGEYMVMGDGDVATEIDIDTTQQVVGKLDVDAAGGTITVHHLTLNYDEDNTDIYIDDDDADLEDLAAYLAQNPGTLGAVLFATDGDRRILTEVDIDSETYIDGPLTLDLDHQQVIVGGIAMQVSDDDTYFTINEEDADLKSFVLFAQRNHNLRASAAYYVTDGVVTADEVDVDTTQEIAGTLTVDVADSQVTIGTHQLPVTDDTSIYINGDPATLEEIAAYAQRNPTVPGRAMFTVDDTATTLYVWVATQRSVSGPISVDLSASTATVGTTTAAIRDDTTIWLNRGTGTFQDLAAFVQRNPGITAYGTVATDGTAYFTSLNVSTITSTYSGVVTADPVANTVTVNGTTATIAADSSFYADYHSLTLADFLQWLAQHPDNSGWIEYVADAGNLTLVEAAVHSKDSSTTANARRGHLRRHAHRVVLPHRVAHRQAPVKKPVKPTKHGPVIHSRAPKDMVGLLTGVDAAHGTLTFLPRGVGRLMVVHVRPRTAIELNAAQLPFSQLALTFAPGQQLWMEMQYERRTHVAWRVWVEQTLRRGAGQVLAVSPRAITGTNPGLTLTVAVTYSGRVPRTTSMQLQLLPHSIVVKGRRLIRPDQIRRGDTIRFDGFTQSGKNFMPRILVLSSKKR